MFYGNQPEQVSSLFCRKALHKSKNFILSLNFPSSQLSPGPPRSVDNNDLLNEQITRSHLKITRHLMRLYSPHECIWEVGKRKWGTWVALGLRKFSLFKKFLSQLLSELPLHSLLSTYNLKTTSPIRPDAGSHHLDRS